MASFQIPETLTYQQLMRGKNGGRRVWKRGPALEVIYLSIPQPGKKHSRVEIPFEVPELELVATGDKNVPLALVPKHGEDGKVKLQRQLPDNFDPVKHMAAVAKAKAKVGKE